MSGAKVEGGETWRRETEVRVMMTASPGCVYAHASVDRCICEAREKERKERKERTGLNVLPIPESTRIRHDALTRKQPILPATPRLPTPHPQRPNPIRIPPRNNPKPSQHRHTRIRSFHLLHEPPNSSKYVLFVDPEFSCLLEVVGEDVEEEFGVGGGVDVPVGFGVHEV